MLRKNGNVFFLEIHSLAQVRTRTVCSNQLTLHFTRMPGKRIADIVTVACEVLFLFYVSER